MAYDEGLPERLHDAMADIPGVTEKENVRRNVHPGEWKHVLRGM